MHRLSPNPAIIHTRMITLWTLCMTLLAATAFAQQNPVPVFIPRPFADVRFGSLLLMNRAPGAINQFGTDPLILISTTVKSRFYTFSSAG